MCFTLGASLCLATISFCLSFYEYKCFRCWQYSFGIAYWGIMELLQVVQHIYVARPEDDYAMCQNWVNQKLTAISNIHLVFQPAVTSLMFMGMYRRHDIEARIIGDFLFRLCLLAALWWPSYSWISFIMDVDQELLPPASKECPNYQWMYEGYDGYLQERTPNMPGRPCVYYASTWTGHLAWAIPIFKQTYFFPSPNFHFLLFFGPYIIMFKRPFLQAAAFLGWLTGPFLTKKLTSSVNEAPAIWCFYSVAQVAFFVFFVRWYGLHKQPVPARIHHPGSYGEEPLTYIRNDSAKSAKESSNINGTNLNGSQNLSLEEHKHV